MKIKRLVLENVKSFGSETSFDFDDGLNIFVGPNAGGKSNLLDIINIVLSSSLLYHWRLIEDTNDRSIIWRKRWEDRTTSIFQPLDKFLDKHSKTEEKPQAIALTVELGAEDLANITLLYDMREELSAFEKTEYYNSRYLGNFIASLSEEMLTVEGPSSFTIQMNERQISVLSSDKGDEKYQQVLLTYLRHFELFSLLIADYNAAAKDEKKVPSLFPPVTYFSPYRIPSSQNLTVNISGADRPGLMLRYKMSHSKEVSSAFEIANLFFARKFLHSLDSVSSFNQDADVTLCKEYLQRLGYIDFTYNLLNRDKNIYEAQLGRPTGEVVEMTRASSGEKEIFNMLLGVIAFNVRNGVVIVDEPELHLHPKWQHLLLDVFKRLSLERDIQFFITTHSPHFLRADTVANVARIYMNDGESSIIKPGNIEEAEQDLLRIVNATNNEKIFFSDKVVLVEGITDLIVYSAALDLLQIENIDSAVVQVIDIGGCGGIELFHRYLGKWEIPCYSIIDSDGDSKNIPECFKLSSGDLEHYCKSILNKQHYDTKAALFVAKAIRSDRSLIPKEIEDILTKILDS